jgi:Domain of unknown function (DUF222)
MPDPTLSRRSAAGPPPDGVGRTGFAWLPDSAATGPVPAGDALFAAGAPLGGSLASGSSAAGSSLGGSSSDELPAGLDWQALLEALAMAGIGAGTDEEQEAILAEELAADSQPMPAGPLAALAAEEMAPGPAQAGWLGAAARDCEVLDENALAGVAIAARRLGAWAQAAELGAVAQIAARAAAADPKIGLARDGRPGRLGQDAISQVSLALMLSDYSATNLAELAVTLRWRLPATGQALAEGRIDLYRARLIADATSVLSEEAARGVEAKVLPEAGGQVAGDLRARLRRAVITADPDGAEQRRQEAERHAKISLYGDHDGTATLAGSKLPAIEAAAAMARITALARAMKAAGQDGGLDLHRARVMLGLLLGTLPYIPPAPGARPDEPPPDEPPPDEPRSGGGHGPGGQGPGGGDPGGHGPGGQGPGGGDPGGHGPGGQGPGAGDPGGGDPGGQGPGGGYPRGRNGASDSDPGEGRGPGGGHGPGDSGSGGGAGETIDPGHPNAADGGRLRDAMPGQGDGGPWGDLPDPRDEDAPDDDGWTGDDSPDDDSPDDDSPDDDTGGGLRGNGPGNGEDDHAEGSRAPWPALGVIPPGLAGRPSVRTEDGRPVPGLLDVTLPWTVLAGLSHGPGTLGRIGPITAAQTRQLAEAAEADPAAQWRIIVTSNAGHAIAVSRIRRPRDGPGPARDGPGGRGGPGAASGSSPGARGGPGPARDGPGDGDGPGPARECPGDGDGLRPGTGLVGRLTLIISEEEITSSQHGPGGRDHGGLSPPGGMAAIALRTAARALAEALAQAKADEAAGGCAHQSESQAYRPPPRLREFVTARDVTCRFLPCRQPAWRADLDHTVPWDDGGRSCRCNLGGGCRRHHQLKQHPRWQLRQDRPGVFTWTTPGGRTYTTGPGTQPV